MSLTVQVSAQEVAASLFSGTSPRLVAPFLVCCRLSYANHGFLGSSLAFGAHRGSLSLPSQPQHIEHSLRTLHIKRSLRVFRSASLVVLFTSMWTGSSGAYRASQPTQPAGDAPHPSWNSQNARGTGYMWERDEVPNRVSHHASPSSTKNSGLDTLHPGPYSVPRAPEVDASADGLPEPPKSFPELETMSLRDLRLLNEERARFDDFVSKHQYQQQLDSIVSRVRTNVDALEREHVTITARMDEAVDDEAFETLQRDVAELDNQVRSLQKQKEEWLEQNSPERLMERLRTAMRESESKSEALEKNMLSSSMHFDEFLAQYIACRQKYHERSLKLEQLQMEVKKKSFGR